jgi:hypothetical protein
VKATKNNREQQIIAAFVTLSTSLAEGFDVVDLLSGLTADCARLLDVASAGLLLADARGVLHLVAASSQETRSLELFQLQRAEGPCLDCYHAGAPISVPDLSVEIARWPQFVPAALSEGFASVHAVPIRLRGIRLGALNLFGTAVGSLNADDLALGQALAHVASVALVHGEAATDKDLILTQLNTALTSRVLIEQAKGVLAQTAGLDMEQAFTVLRRYAREHHQGLSEVAAAVVRRELAPEQFVDQPARQSGPRRNPPGSNKH